MAKLELYDTTLRDGTQREGISLSVKDKLEIARKIDQMGIHYIEGGWPGANPKDVEFFERARTDLHLKHARLVAFGSTRRAHGAAENDPTLAYLIDSGAPICCIVGKSSAWQVRDVLGTTPDENLEMVGESVAYLKSKGRQAFYDAEHFFDGFKADPEYSKQCLLAAAAAGVDCIILCDTNGGTLPSDVFDIVREAIATVPHTGIGIHCHNDCELAVANSLAAVDAGATHVQGTINGYGERCGNANLCAILPNLQLKLGHSLVSDEQLASLTEVSRAVAEIANLTPDSHQAYIGRSAFAHKAGLHVSAILKSDDAYQHVNPALVGNEKRVLVSELSGRGNISYKAAEYGLDLDGGREQAQAVVEEIKELEAQGYQFEGAEASFQLLLRRSQPNYTTPFELVAFSANSQRRNGDPAWSDATVQVKVKGELFHTAAEGNGPVNALDAAIRKALLNFYPELADISLADYKVRVLEGAHGTAARVRVLIESERSDGTRWTTVGSSENIIEASCRALTDSLEFVLTETPKPLAALAL
ncbi:MAG TPA: citramalate synthase [Chloroflexota bacterium]|nr:citramalate synthase [Chloroflexota bacterium]